MPKLLRRKRIFSFFLIVILITILHYLQVLSPLERLIFNFLSPVSIKLNNTANKINIYFSDKKEEQEMVKKIQELKNENSALQAQKAELESLRIENKHLQEQLNFFSSHDWRRVTARVVVSDTYLDAYQNIKEVLLDKGSRDGLIPGLILINEAGVVIGKVTKVEDKSAQACLTVSESCKVAISLQNQDRTIGVSEGALGLTMHVNFIPKNEKISLGDMVVTSSLIKNIPAGLLLGKIINIENQGNDIWQSADLEPLYSSRELNTVAIILPTN
ncbi:MAG: rod shape-determining protein MreC [Planctomycetes bacterium]|jgi:rod shape-determining protein MreC|nr:rod shape-determining protein MreC [Planctomycetota bacterium]